MSTTPDRALNRWGLRKRIVVGLMSIVALGILAGVWFTDQGWQPGAEVAILSAADPNRADKPAAEPNSESAGPDDGAPSASTAKFDAPSVEYFDFPRPSKLERRILEALDRPTHVDFAQVPLEKCIEELRDIHKILILLDKVKITDEQIALDQPITLKLAGVSLRSILKLLLEPVQLTYLIENDMLKIFPGGTCDFHLMTRIYPVRDLYCGPSDANSEERPGDLERAIVKMIQPDSWEKLSGLGTMAYVRASGCLIIRQTPAVHDEILGLLRTLREAKRVSEGHVAPAKPADPKTGWQLRGPQREETYSLVGIIDLDGDEKSDRLRLHEMIKTVGARIDNEVNDKGELYVDGRIEDKPVLAENTKFVVVGTIPQPADLADPDEIATGLKIAQFYADLTDLARDRGVRVISLKDFLRYLGYEPSSAPAPNH